MVTYGFEIVKFSIHVEHDPGAPQPPTLSLRQTEQMCITWTSETARGERNIHSSITDSYKQTTIRLNKGYTAQDAMVCFHSPSEILFVHAVWTLDRQLIFLTFNYSSLCPGVYCECSKTSGQHQPPCHAISGLGENLPWSFSSAYDRSGGLPAMASLTFRFVLRTLHI